MIDDHFTRSVIYLCEHNEDGSFGFILNNTLDLDLAEFTKGFPDLPVTVGFGGPVDQNQLFFLHSIPTLEGAIFISENVYMGGDYTSMLDQLANDSLPASTIRFFIGYTGWGPNQLNEELAEKTWIIATPPSPEYIMQATDDTLWKDVIQSFGAKYKMMADYPINPANN